jgi:hypothetical protein
MRFPGSAEINWTGSPANKRQESPRRLVSCRHGARPGKVGRAPFCPVALARATIHSDLLDVDEAKPFHGRPFVSFMSSVSLSVLFLFLCLNYRTGGTLITLTSVQRPVTPPFDQASEIMDGG